MTTTPRKHWLFDYFGPLQCKCSKCGEVEVAIQEGELEECPKCGGPVEVIDKLTAFKRDSLVVTLLASDNTDNLEADFVAKRRQSLTAAEARVLIGAEWEDTDSGQRFLPSMIWWDMCQERLPPLGKHEPMVVGVDAATGRQSGLSDCFGIVGVTRHPDPARKKTDVAVRFVQSWQAKAGRKIDFVGTERNPGPELVLRKLCGDGFNVKMIAFDPTELNDMAQRFRRERLCWMFEFSQQTRRIEADTDLLRMIQEKRIAHSGEPELRAHLDNADRRTDSAGKRLRIVKRNESKKVDLSVCLSMAIHECLRLNLI